MDAPLTAEEARDLLRTVKPRYDPACEAFDEVHLSDSDLLRSDMADCGFCFSLIRRCIAYRTYQREAAFWRIDNTGATVDLGVCQAEDSVEGEQRAVYMAAVRALKLL